MNSWTLLVNLTVKSTLLLALAWLGALLLRRRSAAARHIVWTAAFAALLALPLLSLSLPAWPHPFANALLRADSGVTFQATATAPRGTVATAGTGTPANGAGPARPAPVTRDPRGLALGLYLAGVLFALWQMLRAYLAIAKLRRTLPASPYQPQEFGIAEPVRLLETEAGMPMAAGVLRPAIFLPAESAGWTWERLRVVVLHEYAHIVRGDAAAQLLARAALCLHWFNPLAWFAWREFLKERERAADDLVLQSGAAPADYAGHLLEIARTMQTLPAGAAAGIAMARRSQLEGRLLAILDSRVQRGAAGRTALAAALLAALALAAPLATVRAQSQAEQQPPPDVQQSIATANAQKNHELLEQAAAAYEKLRQFAEAQKLREAALALRKVAGNAQYAEGLVRLGQLAQKRGQDAEATDYYLQAVQLGDMPETYPALVSLGLTGMRNKSINIAGVQVAQVPSNLTQSRDYLERARNVARTGDEMGRAMTYLALLDQDDPTHAAEAESIFRAALSVESSGSSQQASTTEFLARFLRTLNRGEEAGPLEASAAAMRRALVSKLGAYAMLPSGVHRVGNGVTAPRLLHKVEPSYSEEARAARLQGTVLLKVTIDVDGIAKDIRVMKSLGFGLDEKAVEALAAWRFKPGELAGGALVPVEAQIEINFRLL